MNKKVRDTIYNVGVVVSFLGLSGIAEAITGQGSHMGSIMIFTIGLLMCLTGYVK